MQAKIARILKASGGEQEVSIATATKAIRAKCLDCAGGSAYEVKHCPSSDCPLYQWRFGKHPFRRMSAEQRQAAAERLAKYRRGADGAP